MNDFNYIDLYELCLKIKAFRKYLKEKHCKEVDDNGNETWNSQSSLDLFESLREVIDDFDYYLYDTYAEEE